MTRFRNVALAAGSLLVTLVLVESVLRWTGYEYKPLHIDIRNADSRGYHAFEDEHFVYDVDLLWCPKPSFGVFNSQGFRDPELPSDKPEHAFWIFALGDSNTLGWPGEEGGNWPGSLRALLPAGCHELAVINAGVWGYSSYQGRVLIEKILEYRPDLVLISFGSNDARPVQVPDSQYGVGSAWLARIRTWLAPFHLGQLILGVSRQWIARGSEAQAHRVGLPEYRQNLREMVRLARARGSTAVLLTRPYRGPISKRTTWKSFGPDYNAATADVAEKLRALLIDLYTHFKDRDTLFANDSHFTHEGHKMAAEIILRRLKPWIPIGEGC